MPQARRGSPKRCRWSRRCSESRPSGRYPALSLSPQRQKERTLEVLLEQLEGLAARQPVLAVFEDVHWIDPTTLEMLDLVVDRVRAPAGTGVDHLPPRVRPALDAAMPTSPRCRSIAWAGGRARRMVERLTGGKAAARRGRGANRGQDRWRAAVRRGVDQNGAGVRAARDAGDRYELAGPLPPLAIPATLHDFADGPPRPPRPGQGGGPDRRVIGREFSHELLAAVAPLGRSRAAARAGSAGRAPSWSFAAACRRRRPTASSTPWSKKRPTRACSKSKRQQLHARIASVLQERFPDLAEQRPEELAHHFTEAGLIESAVDQWHKAGQQAADRSANLEAIAQLKKALELLKAIPESRARDEKEAAVQITLGVPLIAVKGYGGLEVQEAYARALELCQKTGNTNDLFPVLRGLWNWHLLRSDMTTTSRLATQLVDLAQSQRDADALVAAHRAIGSTLLFVGNFGEAKQRLEDGLVHYDRRRHRSYTTAYGEDPGVVCRLYAAWCMDFLGYREEALRQMDHALALARELAHPFSLAFALSVSPIPPRATARAGGRRAARRCGEAVVLSARVRAVESASGFPARLGVVCSRREGRRPSRDAPRADRLASHGRCLADTVLVCAPY